MPHLLRHLRRVPRPRAVTVPQTKGVAAPSQTLAPWSSNWDAPMTSLFRDPFFSRELTPFGGFGGLGGLGGFGGFGGLGLTPFRGAFDELAAMQQRLQASMPASELRATTPLRLGRRLLARGRC